MMKYLKKNSDLYNALLWLIPIEELNSMVDTYVIFGIASTNKNIELMVKVTFV